MKCQSTSWKINQIKSRWEKIVSFLRKNEKLKNWKIKLEIKKWQKWKNTKLLFIQFEITAIAVSVEIENFS